MNRLLRKVCILGTIVIGVHGPMAEVVLAEAGAFERGKPSFSLRPQFRSLQEGGGVGIDEASEPTQEGREEQLWDGDGILEPGEDEMAELSRAVQNPVSDLISLPFQNITNFGVGPKNRVANVLNIQPVIPFSLNEEWNFITRTIVPIVYKPAFFDEGDDFGLGDIQFAGFFSPANSGSILWGAGPVLRVPTATDDLLGSEKWSAGLSFVALTMKGPWVVGGLVQNVWSFAGESDRHHVSEFLLQPFINYNLPDGWYLTTSPIITANWNAEDSSDAWTIPVGGGVGRVFRIGRLPVNLGVQGYYNVEKPSFGPDWSLRVQFSLLFPRRSGS